MSGSDYYLVCSEVIRTHDWPETLVFPYVYTPCMVPITVFPHDSDSYTILAEMPSQLITIVGDPQPHCVLVHACWVSKHLLEPVCFRECPPVVKSITVPEVVFSTILKLECAALSTAIKCGVIDVGDRLLFALQLGYAYRVWIAFRGTACCHCCFF